MSSDITRARRTHTAREMAERFAVSPRTVRRVIAEERVSYESRANERRAQIIELHRQGWTGRAIATHLKVSPGLVSTRLREAREAGVDLTPHPRQDDAAQTDDGQLPGQTTIHDVLNEDTKQPSTSTDLGETA